MRMLLKTIVAGCVLALSLPTWAQDKLKVQWYGQAAFKTTTPTGKVIVIDPWITSSEPVWKDATGKDQMLIGGEACGFIIELENGFKIWHLGDTGLYGDMKILGERHKVDLLLTPIGGGQFVMNPEDAAYAARELIKPKAVIPMHYAANKFLVGTPEQFGKAMGPGSAVKVLQVKEGDTVAF